MNEEIKYYYDVEQGSEEWLKLRSTPTASVVSGLISPKGKIANNKTSRGIALSLAIQRESGFAEDSYQSFDMQRGHLQEVIARDYYSDCVSEVKECGFIIRSFGDFSIGCSPDGLVGVDGGIEIKSRLAKFQIETIVKNEVPAEYMDQIQTCMLVSGRKWWDFVQYSNGLPMYIKRVFPDLERQELIIEASALLEKEIVNYQEIYRENIRGLIKTEWQSLNSDDVILDSEVI